MAEYGRWGEAEESMTQILEARRERKAEELEMQVMKRKKKIFGLEYLSTLLTITNMVQSFTNRRQWAHAGDLCRKLVEKKSRVFGQDHSETLSRMADLASIITHQERYEEAIALDLKVLDRCRHINSEEHHVILASMVNLVVAFSLLGRRANAKIFEKQAMKTVLDM
ncbi:hypothetical protein HO133_005407 [Letharia lupina]|uniref:Kinesin light chain n=1 Tax=Letharia lupina TaxID=560253 RepID=A0A8H6C8M3_9LECA|nr:uncharacterized protein HO133_005407 [Letharia lupina]KAF6218864.1 hypothetical protein HO133_005407 [Letharia lupina]